MYYGKTKKLNIKTSPELKSIFLFVLVLFMSSLGMAQISVSGDAIFFVSQNTFITYQDEFSDTKTITDENIPENILDDHPKTANTTQTKQTQNSVGEQIQKELKQKTAVYKKISTKPVLKLYTCQNHKTLYENSAGSEKLCIPTDVRSQKKRLTVGNSSGDFSGFYSISILHFSIAPLPDTEAEIIHFFTHTDETVSRPPPAYC